MILSSLLVIAGVFSTCVLAGTPESQDPGNVKNVIKEVK
jgi:hypothetical protein